MENSLEHIELLISKYLAGEASQDEIRLLDNWRQQSADNEALFTQSKKLFDAVQDVNPALTVNVDAAWQNLSMRINEPEASVIPLNRRYSPARVAAAVLLLVALAFVVKMLFISPDPVPMVLLSSTTTVPENLPDGSKVFMNKNAELSYVVKEGKRLVKLKGEAFFEVKHDAAQPFVIEVNEVMIKDIGTAFNVKALPESNLVEVLVESGEVQFYSASSPGLALVKGEKATYNKLTKEFARLKPEVNDNTLSYRSHIFHFNNTALDEVLRMINSIYGSHIQLANQELANCHLTVKFNNQDLETVVSVIAETLDLSVERKDSTITLKGRGCAN